jgi:hypothetical protein
MKKKLNLLIMLVSLLALSMVFIGCDDGSGNRDIVPIELQGTWEGSFGTVTIDSSSMTVVRADGISGTTIITSIQKGVVVNNYTRYVLGTNQGDVNLELSQDGEILRDSNGYTFYKV